MLTMSEKHENPVRDANVFEVNASKKQTVKKILDFFIPTSFFLF